MKLTGKLVDVNLDFISGVPKVTLSINERGDFLEGIDAIKDLEKLSIEIKPFRPKRSLDANAYCWQLIGELADRLNVPKVEVYRKAIKEIGGNFEIVCVKNEAVKRLRDGWGKNGLGWISEEFPSKIDACTNVILYFGSSAYDTQQMSRLIDNIVQDCKALGIQTETPEKIAELKSLWGAEQ